MASSDIIFLHDAKLRVLADRIHGIERKNLGSLQFHSTTEQLVYLRISSFNLRSVGSVLDQSGETVNKYKDDAVRGPIAALIFTYTETCLNNALQIFNNYNLRRDYLDKVHPHLHNLINELDDLDTSSSTDVATLTNLIVNYNKAVINYTKMTENNPASQEFSRRLKSEGIDFPTLVNRYKANYGFTEPFDNLTDEQKLLVYNAIIEASGRGKVLNDEMLKAIAVPGSFSSSNELKDISIKDVFAKGVFMYNAATITWDVYSSEHKMNTATRDAITNIASKGGAVLEDIVEAAMLTLEVEAETSLLVTGVGFVVGILGSYILGQIAGKIFDLIFGSGGTATLPDQGYILYVATMPDGKDLARLVA